MPTLSCRRPRIWLLTLLACAIASVSLAQTGSVVTVNADRALVVNGRKVFPIGFSPGPPVNGVTPIGNDAMQEFRDAGALLVRMVQNSNWSSQVISDQQAYLDWAYGHGMFCWVNLRELSEFTATDTNTPAALRNIVDTFRNHPGVGLWKNFDEAWWGGVSEADLQRGYEVIKQEDTNHPVVQTHAPRGTVSDLQPYNAAADVLALDIYPVAIPPPSNPPITNTQISQVGDWTKVLSQVANGQKEYWLIEQIAFSGTTPPSKTLIFPTFQQSRYMAYQAIVNGARGMMFFGGNIAATLDSQDAPLGWNWTFWTNVLKSVVLELGDKGLLTNALVAPDSTMPVTMSGTTPPDIEFCVREVPPYLYLLATKREGTNSVQITFSGLPASAGVGDVLYESGRTVTAQNGQFTDSFAPFDVHVYRFYISDPSPTIISPPQSQTNILGTTASFSVLASGFGPLSYQWRKNGVNLTDGGNLSGALSPSLTVSNVSLSNAGNYEVVVTGFGSVTSAPPATLVVTNYQSNQVPIITSQPLSQTNYQGTTAAFSVTASGNDPFLYQWRKNGSNMSDSSSVSGANTPSLTLSSVSVADAASYDVVVTGFINVTSAPAALTIIPSQTAQLALYEPFYYQNVGTQVSLNNPANWTFNGSGANDLNVAAGNLSYPNLATSLGNSVTNGGPGLGTRRLFGTNFSSGLVYFSALFRINDLGYGAWNGASSQLGALTATDNQSFRLQVLVKSNSPSGYVIGVQKGGTGVTATFGATEYHAGDTLLLVGKYDFTQATNRVSLWVNPSASSLGAASEPTNGFVTANTGTDGFVIDRFNMRQNTAASVPASIQWDELRVGMSWAAVTPLAPAAIGIPPQSQTVLLGQNATFTVTASGAAPLAYQWRFNGNVVPGATGSSYTVSLAKKTDDGAYRVTVTNAVGTATSADAWLSVVALGAWGENSWGQSTVPGTLSNVVAVAAGAWHSLALQADGHVAAWGNDGDAQCDVPAALTNAIAIAAGGYHSLAIRADGSVAVWGGNEYGQTTVPASATNVIGIAAGLWHSVALRANGTVAAWGDNSAGQTALASSLTNVAALAAGGNHSIALNADGTVVAWGENTDSNGNFVGQSIVPPGLSNVVAIAAGSYHSMAVKGDGTVVVWGDNSQSQCEPPAGLAGVVAAAGGGAHSVALRTNGTVTAWGANSNGQCSLPPTVTNAVGVAAGGYDTLVLVDDGTFVPRLFSPSRKGNRFSAVAQTFNRKSYGLEFKTALTNASWTPLPTVSGSGALRMLTDTNAATLQRFYRARQQ